MKKILLFASIALGAVALISAPIVGSALALSDTQKQVISGEYDTIHQVLKTLQKTDTKTRTNLGYRYKTILDKYMIPLSSRLAKNSIANAEFVGIQSDFSNARQAFNDDFIVYK